MESRKTWTVAGGQWSFIGGISPSSLSIRLTSLWMTSSSVPEKNPEMSLPLIFSVNTEAEAMVTAQPKDRNLARGIYFSWYPSILGAIGSGEGHRRVSAKEG